MENEEILDNATELQTTENSDIEVAQISEEAIEAVATTNSDGNLIDDTTEVKVDSNIENAKWYVLHTFSGYENVAKENLEIVREKYNLQERIFDIVIPMEDVVEDKNGKTKQKTFRYNKEYADVKLGDKATVLRFVDKPIIEKNNSHN